jgi:hypothetical protein
MKIFFQVYPERDFNLRRLLQRQADGRLRLLRRRIHRRRGTGSIQLLLLQFVKIKIYFYRNSNLQYVIYKLKPVEIYFSFQSSFV